MKVVFSIYSAQGKPGGHFFSFEHTITALQSSVEVVIIYIGHEHPVIEALPFTKFNVSADVKGLSKVRFLINKEEPDVIHCFDGISYRFVSVSTLRLNKKIVMTIPGGNPNPSNVPYCKDIILFSKETMKTFGDCQKFKSSDLFYIPNRVYKRLLKCSSHPDNNVYSFLQVIRINKGKHLQILKTLQFLKKILEEGIPACLILAGTVNTPSEKDFIEQYVIDNNLKESFLLITDERVNRGSDLIAMSDCVIGTGRSVMESSILGKSVLVPVQNMDYPILLDEDSFDSLIHYNFSGRTTKIFSDSEFEKIRSIISDNQYKLHNKQFIKKISDNFFELNTDVINKYLSIYCNAHINNVKVFTRNLSINVKFFLKLFWGKELI